ncbi:MAG: 50S ribosomal protein L15, partial [Balneolaceae bacterium]
MNLHELEAPAQNKKSRKRVGRGQGSGRGEQSGRGHNGQNSRSGSKVKRWFEGGQMPLQRRIPKFGFKNRFRTEYQSVNISQIQDYLESGRLSEKITLDDLISQGLANKGDLVKLLGS